MQSFGTLGLRVCIGPDSPGHYREVFRVCSFRSWGSRDPRNLTTSGREAAMAVEFEIMQQARMTLARSPPQK